MDKHTYQYLHKDAITALKEHHLLSALQSLQGMASSLKEWSIKEEADTLVDSYQILLSYLVKGAADPERHKMYKSFERRAYELADMLERAGDLQNETSFYATSLRTLKNLHGNHFTLSDLLQEGVSARDIFDAVWLSGAWTTADETTVANFMADANIIENNKCLLLSAATLSAMRYFDIAKYRLLLDNALSDEVKVRVRAIVGLVFVHIAHPERTKFYPEVATRLQLMLDIQNFVNQLELLQSQLFLSLETKRIEQNLQNEIIPQVMKRIEHLHIDRSLGLDEIKDKLSEADLNPEWDEDGRPSKLAKYMHEFVELQERGADMYMGSFKVMKQRFSFFNVVCNWFYPFTMNHPEVPQGLSENRMLKVLINRTGLCDSDKYSFCLMMSQMKNQTQEHMDQFVENMGNVDLTSEDVLDPTQLFKEEMRSYVQGFYRFCNLYLHREEFVNPFQLNLFLADHFPFQKLLDDDDMLQRLAEFEFKDKSYNIALDLYKKLPQEKLTANIFQKMGYCYEQEGNVEQAIILYERANLLKPHSKWTIKRLAASSRAAGNYAKAFDYYTELEEFLPEDADVALHQAESLICLQRYDEAFKYLFKANYLKPQSALATRALAWCSLLTGKYEQAEKYYQKVLEHAPTPTDYLNAGHTAWLQGHIAEAVSRYRNARNNDSKTLEFLKEDEELLKRAGLTDEDLAMMKDALSV